MGIKRLCLVLGLVGMALSGCGGGSGGESAPPAAPLPETLTVSAPADAGLSSEVQFRSSAAALTGLSFEWNFGDGTTSTEAAPKHVYAKAGSYQVQLKVRNAAGLSRQAQLQLGVANWSHLYGAACTSGAAGGWCKLKPTLDEQDFYAFSFVDSQRGFAATGSGDVVKTLDGGASWQRTLPGLQMVPQELSFSDAGNAWLWGEVAGQGSVPLRTRDGGASFQNLASLPQSQSKGRPFYAVYVLGTAGLLATDGDTEAQISTDGGASWRPSNYSGWATSYFREDGRSVGGIRASSRLWRLGVASVELSTDLGLSYQSLPALPAACRTGWLPFRSLQVYGEQRLLLLGYERLADDPRLVTRRACASLDGGLSWTAYPVDARLRSSYYPSYEQARSYSDSDRFWLFADGQAIAGALLGSQQQLLRAGQPGASWKAVPLVSDWGSYVVFVGRQADTLGMWKPPLLSASPAAYFFSLDGGSSWIGELNDDQRLQFYGPLARISDVSLLQKRSGGGLYRSDDAGKTWTLLRAPMAASPYFSGAWFVDGRRGVAVASSGLLGTEDGGKTWVANTSAGFKSPQAIVSASAKRGWVSDWNGSAYDLYRSDDGGRSWALLKAGMREQVQFFLDESRGWSVSSSGDRVLASSDGGASWAARGSVSFGIKRLHFSDASRGLALSVRGYAGAPACMALSSDGGASWGACTSIAGVDEFYGVTSKAGELWVVGSGGAILRSADGGASWTRLASGTGNALHAIAFADASNGWVVGEQGTVLATQDGGQTWRRQPVPTGQAIKALAVIDKSTVWLLGDEGVVLGTASGGF